MLPLVAGLQPVEGANTRTKQVVLRHHLRKLPQNSGTYPTNNIQLQPSNLEAQVGKLPLMSENESSKKL
jgi:hypothetical protein